MVCVLLGLTPALQADELDAQIATLSSEKVPGKDTFSGSSYEKTFLAFRAETNPYRGAENPEQRREVFASFEERGQETILTTQS